MGGFATTNLRIAGNWRQQNGFGIVSNYEFDYRFVRRPSVVINPKIEFCWNPVYGLAISPIFILNDEASYFGIGINNILGYLKP
jgi:hypothetical protein